MGWLWTLIVGGILGWLAGLIISKDVPFGIIGNIIAGLIGASIGNAIGLDFGPTLGGMSIIGTLAGAIILILVVSFIFNLLKGNKKA
ncbi:GlsB/YeaQ/YmgE family stress response membrane protein [Jeotgalicoccus huakuii]|uniref:GlsB/YeaQ/YmgE family stress response membrane protein n=1 Tax=Jeotgalicoccus TaxID=227979 RepID=UPI0004150C7E|nr:MULTISPECIES: GlsB/YeaQ/YmgE family stress response membrane protein [Jeotgalicoccus]MCK1977559.1 GlsB/YeaQ/YmgE family stress response membrane protein [Jeotgalicoccus huakuii]QQD84096.1 GlsB/YeaQ/YmgE family stress response membrane protein [Jeotgalicoccus sp. ATCC 8456]